MRGLQAKPFQSSPTEIATAIEGGAHVRRSHFESSVSVAASGDFALAMSLLASMALASPLRVAAPVDPGLLERQERIQARLAEWNPRFSRVPVGAPERPPPESPAGGVGSFFSGGLDSFHTLLAHREEITHLIVIHGFDYPPGDHDLRARVSEMTHTVARALDLEVIEVDTDAKGSMIDLVPWNWYHGGLLAGIALALEEHVSRVLIPATHALRTQVPWGQHPEIDPLWSTARVVVATADPEPTRLEKAALVGESELAMGWLRVCWERPDQWNCGRCEKCLRTMVDLAVWGRLGECRTLPDTIDLDAARALVLRTPGKRGYVRESLEQLRRDGAERDLADALEVALRRWRYRVARERVIHAPAGAARRARNELERMRIRLGRSRSR